MEESTKFIQSINHDAKFYFNHYPTPTLQEIPKEINKNADIVFAARLSKDKGIDDLIESCKFVKKKFPDFILKIVGHGSQTKIENIKQKINEYGLKDNVNFIGFLPAQEDVLIEELTSKICV